MYHLYLALINAPGAGTYLWYLKYNLYMWIDTFNTIGAFNAKCMQCMTILGAK
jgi:hypothetical protein